MREDGMQALRSWLMYPLDAALGRTHLQGTGFILTRTIYVAAEGPAAFVALQCPGHKHRAGLKHLNPEHTGCRH